MIKHIRSPLGVVFVTLLLDKLGENIVYPLLPFILEVYQPDGLTLGLLAATSTLFAVVASPLVGSFSDAYGRRPIVLVCILLNMVSLLLFGWAGSLPLIFFSRAINGIATSTTGTLQAYISDISAPENRSRNLGISGAAFGLGAIAGPALGGGLVGLGAHVPVFVAAALAGYNALLASRFLGESLPRERRQAFRAQALNVIAPILGLVQRVRINRIAIAFACFNLAFSAFTSLLVLNLKQSFGWGAAQSSGILVVVGVTLTYVQVAQIGTLVHRHGEHALNRAGMLIVGLGIALMPLALLWRGAAAVLIVLAGILLAIGAAFVIPTARSMVSGLVSASEQGVTLGSLMALTGLASAAGPVAAGAIFDQSPLLCFLLEAGVCVVGVLVLGPRDVSAPGAQDSSARSVP